MLLSWSQWVLRITGTVSFRDQEALHLSWYASSVSFSLFGGAASIAAFATRTATFIAIKPSGDTRHTLHISEYPISLTACSWEWMKQEDIICWGYPPSLGGYHTVHSQKRRSWSYSWNVWVILLSSWHIMTPTPMTNTMCLLSLCCWSRSDQHIYVI